jgi:hypothetical protein
MTVGQQQQQEISMKCEKQPTNNLTDILCAVELANARTNSGLNPDYVSEVYSRASWKYECRMGDAVIRTAIIDKGVHFDHHIVELDGVCATAKGLGKRFYEQLKVQLLQECPGEHVVVMLHAVPGAVNAYLNWGLQKIEETSSQSTLVRMADMLQKKF